MRWTSPEGVLVIHMTQCSVVDGDECDQERDAKKQIAEMKRFARVWDQFLDGER